MSSSQFSSVGSAETDIIKLEAEISGRPGFIRLYADATGRTMPGIASNLRNMGGFDGSETTARIIVIPSTRSSSIEDELEDFAKIVRRQTSAFKTITGSTVPGIPSNPYDVIPDRLDRRLTKDGYITPILGGRSLGPEEDNLTLNRTFEFTPLKIPTFDRESFGGVGSVPDEVFEFSIADLPDIEFTFEVVSAGVIQKNFQDTPRVKLTLSSRAFVEEISAGAINCDELYSDVQEDITDIDSRLNRARGNLNERLQTLRAQENRLRAGIGEDISVDSLKRLDRSDISSLGEDAVSDIQNTVEEVNVREIDADQLVRDAERIQREARNVKFAKCRDSLSAEADRLMNNARSLEDRYETAIELKSAITDLLGGDIVERPNIRDQITGERLRQLRNRIASFEADVRHFLNKNRLQRDPSRKGKLINEGEDLISDIRNSDKLDGSQKSTLLNRVNETLSRIRGAGARTREALPCGSRFSSVDNDIDDFRGMVVNLKAPVRPQELERVVRRGDRLVDRIESQVPRDSGCRQGFVDEVRALTERAESLTARVRVETQTEEQAKDRSEELIRELLNSLNSVETDMNVEDTADSVSLNT